MLIENGATVTVYDSAGYNYFSIGDYYTPLSNSVTMTGSSTLTVGGSGKTKFDYFCVGNLNPATSADNASTLSVSGSSVVNVYGTAFVGAGDIYNYGSSDTGTSYSTYGNYNSMTVSGSGSTFNVFSNADTQTSSDTGTYTDDLCAPGTLFVGAVGSHNTLTVSDSGSVSTVKLTVGYGASDNSACGVGNTLALTSNATLTATGAVIVGNYGSGNAITVSGGADATFSGTSLVIGANAGSNSVTVSGSGSTLVCANLTTFSIGTASATGNTLVIENSGLVKVDMVPTVATGSYIYIDGGYLAVSGDKSSALATLLSGHYIKYKNTSGVWTTADTSTVSITYYNSSQATEAYNATTYSDLGGYTILTTTPVPEPSTWALFGGLGALGLAGYRRRSSK